MATFTLESPPLGETTAVTSDEEDASALLANALQKMDGLIGDYRLDFQHLSILLIMVLIEDTVINYMNKPEHCTTVIQHCTQLIAYSNGTVISTCLLQLSPPSPPSSSSGNLSFPLLSPPPHLPPPPSPPTSLPLSSLPLLSSSLSSLLLLISSPPQPPPPLEEPLATSLLSQCERLKVLVAEFERRMVVEGGEEDPRGEIPPETKDLLVNWLTNRKPVGWVGRTFSFQSQLFLFLHSILCVFTACWYVILVLPGT